VQYLQAEAGNALREDWLLQRLFFVLVLHHASWFSSFLGKTKKTLPFLQDNAFSFFYLVV
jgi:hypothetical protein